MEENVHARLGITFQPADGMMRRRSTHHRKMQNRDANSEKIKANTAIAWA